MTSRNDVAKVDGVDREIPTYRHCNDSRAHPAVIRTSSLPRATLASARADSDRDHAIGDRYGRAENFQPVIRVSDHFPVAASDRGSLDSQSDRVIVVG